MLRPRNSRHAWGEAAGRSAALVVRQSQMHFQIASSVHADGRSGICWGSLVTGARKTSSPVKRFIPS